jgi:hypothetical protein
LESFNNDVIEEAIGRLREALAILDQVQDSDLLGELPAAEEARARHKRGVCLLAVLKRDLVSLSEELEAAWAAAGVVARATSQQRRRAG